ncbi:P-loop containing nucleoside triphosphate hydrolase protein [Suillus occidentalis]|nr:P-loop containing nucleoside triphosphate hydrolase protein [Suillus occidentalis]
MLNFGGHVLALEVVAAANLPVPSIRIPIGYYINVSTSNGQWNTTTKATTADCSVSWNESLTIHGRPLIFPPSLMPIFPGKSKAIHVELCASYESGPSELLGVFETTFGQVLVSDMQSISCLTVDNQHMSLTLKARRIRTTQLVDHAASSTAESVATDQRVHLPAAIHSIDITGQPPLSLSPHASSSNLERTLPWGGNIVIFGETGTGKSSIINAIAREQLAKTSDDATGCTSSHKRHPVTISGQRFVLFDTAGFGEGPAGRVPDAEAKRQLKSLLCQLMSSRSPSDGIDLLVYCMSSRTTTLPAIVRAYDTFYARVCRKKVPIVIVITGLEKEPNMESWWDKNKGMFKNMRFAGHACVTALQEYPDIPDDFARRIAESSGTLRNLIISNCSHWTVDDSWSKRIAGLWCASSS